MHLLFGSSKLPQEIICNCCFCYVLSNNKYHYTHWFDRRASPLELHKQGQGLEDLISHAGGLTMMDLKMWNLNFQSMMFWKFQKFKMIWNPSFWRLGVKRNTNMIDKKLESMWGSFILGICNARLILSTN
jgi:hypothetical protein